MSEELPPIGGSKHSGPKTSVFSRLFYNSCTRSRPSEVWSARSGANINIACVIRS
jgi:hypothetical protein